MKRMWSKNELKAIADIRAAAVIASGEVDNAKPIYYHPIYFSHNSALYSGEITLVILDNNPTAYTKDTGLAKLKELMDNGVIIQVNGFIWSISSSTMFNAYVLYKSGDNYVISGNSTSTNTNIDLNNMEIVSWVDGVNKIN